MLPEWERYMIKLPEWFKKKQELIILISFILLIGVLIYLGMNMQQSYLGGGEPAEEVEAAKKVKLAQHGGSGNGDGDGKEEGGKEQSKPPVNTYFLKPTPAEIMSMVKDLVDSELPVPKEKYENLRIVWPVYFFQVNQQNGEKVEVQFDTSEDGFGVNVISEIDSLKYPEILTATLYQKIWLAGEITGIEASGTGTIFMKTEHVRFREELEEVERAKEKGE